MSAITDNEFDVERYVIRENPSLFQQLEWIPLVSNVVGAVRGFFGTVQVVVGVFILPFELIYATATGEDRIYLIALGALNIIRGAVAQVSIVGNIVLYLYDAREVVRYRPMRHQVITA